MEQDHVIPSGLGIGAESEFIALIPQGHKLITQLVPVTVLFRIGKLYE